MKCSLCARGRGREREERSIGYDIVWPEGAEHDRERK